MVPNTNLLVYMPNSIFRHSVAEQSPVEMELSVPATWISILPMEVSTGLSIFPLEMGHNGFYGLRALNTMAYLWRRG